jgi:excisionase family DNA binding protein
MKEATLDAIGTETPGRRGRPREATGAVVPRLLDLPGAAAYLSVSLDTVRRLINAGEISIIRVPVSRTHHGEGSKRILIDRQELDELVPRWRERRA